MELVLCLAFVACLSLAGSAQDESRQQHVGRVLDWSYHHVTLSGGLPAADLNRVKTEPRILYRSVERNLAQVPARQELRRMGAGDPFPRRPLSLPGEHVKKMVEPAVFST